MDKRIKKSVVDLLSAIILTMPGDKSIVQARIEFETILNETAFEEFIKYSFIPLEIHVNKMDNILVEQLNRNWNDVFPDDQDWVYYCYKNLTKDNKKIVRDHLNLILKLAIKKYEE